MAKKKTAKKSADPTQAVLEGLRLSVGRKVAQARKDLGLSQRALASAFGKSQGWITNIERGKNFPPLLLLLVLGRAVRRDLNWFADVGVEFDEGTGEQMAASAEELELMSEARAALALISTAGDLLARRLHDFPKEFGGGPRYEEAQRVLIRELHGGVRQALDAARELAQAAGDAWLKAADQDGEET